jgi:hypothetical protein
MANVITAGNSTNGGTSVTTDTSGTLNIVTGSGSGANAITIDASQNVVFSGNVSGNIKSGTAVTASGTSVDFTGIPSTAKRITVMFGAVSTSSTSNLLIQIGSGSVANTGYDSAAWSANAVNTGSTAGYLLTAGNVVTACLFSGSIVITLLNSSTNLWVSAGTLGQTTVPASNGAANMSGGNKALSGVLDRVRITTVNGTDTFDAGSINIFYE